MKIDIYIHIYTYKYYASKPSVLCVWPGVPLAIGMTFLYDAMLASFKRSYDINTHECVHMRTCKNNIQYLAKHNIYREIICICIYIYIYIWIYIYVYMREYEYTQTLHEY